MILKLLGGPVIGMVIGYFTNWLAVKMLFRPREAKYIAGKRLPFTPGVVPRGKARFAVSIGEIVNNQLLTETSVKERLLSEEVKASVKDAAAEFSDQMHTDERSLQECLCSIVDEETLEKASGRLEDIFTEKITQKLQDIHLGSIASGILVTKLGAALSNSFIGKMFGDSMLTNMLPVIEKAVDDYVEENGEQIICAIVHEEKEKLLAKPLSDAALLLDRTEIDLEAAVLKIYEDFVEAKAAVFIRQLDAGSIAKKAILDMDNIQLENLVLSAMKTELQAVVNLGALIGLILGLVNIFIYM